MCCSVIHKLDGDAHTIIIVYALINRYDDDEYSYGHNLTCYDQNLYSLTNKLRGTRIRIHLT